MEERHSEGEDRTLALMLHSDPAAARMDFPELRAPLCHNEPARLTKQQQTTACASFANWLQSISSGIKYIYHASLPCIS